MRNSAPRILALTVFPLALLSASAVFAASDTPPNFDVMPSCRAAAAASTSQDRLQGCLDSEKRARDQVAQEWSKSTPAVRALCLNSSSAGGEPTYTELITCLEMERDSKLKPVNQTSLAPVTDSVTPKTATERAKGH